MGPKSGTWFRENHAPVGLCSACRKKILWQNHHNRAMKYNLPSLTLSLVLGSWAVLAAAETPPSASTPASGQTLVAEAAQRLAAQPAIAAKIRQRAQLFGQELVGSGSYQQLRSRGRLLIRLELRLQVDEQLTTLQQINDGVILWIRHDQGREKSVDYVNLQRVRDAAKKAAYPQALSVSETLAIGGLPQLLQQLDRNFAFDTAREAELSGVPVWIVQGQWKKEKLAALLPEQKQAILSGKPIPRDALPPHIPDSVSVVLGRDDFVPLFPYRLEYTRTESTTEAPGSRAGGRREVTRSIVSMELFEVRKQWEVDPNAFVYPLGDQRIDNLTDVYIRRLGVAPRF